MSECVVYWLHDASCIYVQEHGYVGITSRWNHRLIAHQKNKKFPVFDWTIIFSGTRTECLEMERSLRPEHGIGWNRSRGGKPVVNFTDEVRRNMSEAAKHRDRPSDETKEKAASVQHRQN